MLHILLHFMVPMLLAGLLWRRRFYQAVTVMWMTMLVDLDHLLATPIYDPNRCSIGFHPLHQPLLFPVYLAFLIWPKTRWVGAGLVIHMVLDGFDCSPIRFY